MAGPKIRLTSQTGIQRVAANSNHEANAVLADVMKRILAVLNERAGSLNGRDSDEIRGLVEKVLARSGARVSVRLASGEDIVREIKSGAESDCDTLVIGGGDGSVNVAATMLAGSQKTLGVLPLGTMNLLARDLGMPNKLEDALEALGRARSREIDLARRNSTNISHAFRSRLFQPDGACARRSAQPPGQAGASYGRGVARFHSRRTVFGAARYRRQTARHRNLRAPRHRQPLFRRRLATDFARWWAARMSFRD